MFVPISGQVACSHCSLQLLCYFSTVCLWILTSWPIRAASDQDLRYVSLHKARFFRWRHNYDVNQINPSTAGYWWSRWFSNWTRVTPCLFRIQADWSSYLLIRWTTNLEGNDTALPFVIVNEQSQSNRDCIFQSSFVLFVPGRSYHQDLFISTVAGGMCLCGGRKRFRISSSL